MTQSFLINVERQVLWNKCIERFNLHWLPHKYCKPIKSWTWGDLGMLGSLFLLNLIKVQHSVTRNSRTNSLYCPRTKLVAIPTCPSYWTMLYAPTVEILKLGYAPWTNKGLTWQLPHHHTGSWPHPCRPTAVTSDLQLPGQPGEPGCLQTGSDRFWPIQICSLPSWFVGYCRNFPRFRLHLVFDRKKFNYINWALSCRNAADLVPGAWVAKFPELIIGCLIPSEIGRPK